MSTASQPTQQLSSNTGKLFYGSYSEEKELILDLEGKNNLEVKLLDSDYDEYAVLYSCNRFFGLGRYEFIWILMRQRYEVDTISWNSVKETAITSIKSKLGITDKSPSNLRKFIDTKTYLNATTQGQNYCNYKKMDLGESTAEQSV
mmetsp:Transcript_14983/g.25496  ORF Transcript_14983/g.25496 Transcript_14983/m.25496 type:complete len:146 (-) Transcript_14983:95-532(-)